MWHFSTVTFQLCDNFILWHFDHVTFLYCDIPTLWQFSTFTFHLKVDGLSVHPKSGQFVTLWHSDSLIFLSNPWLWHFVHFGFWFFLAIPFQSCSWFWQMTILWLWQMTILWLWQMTILWHYPFNLLPLRPRSDRGYASGVGFYIIFQI
jgi:hypothetical protein